MTFPGQTTRFFTFNGWSEELAYIMGVYLGDGCIYKGSFIVTTIDRDFLDRVRGCCQRLLSDSLPEPYKVCYETKKKTPRVKWDFRFRCHDLCDWLLKMCADKTRLPVSFPGDDPKLSLALFTGFMDSEGYCAVSKETNGKARFAIGMTCGDPVIHDIIKLAQRMGLHPRKTRYNTSTKAGHPMIDCKFHVDDIARSPFNFTIARKQRRLELIRRVILLNDFTLDSHDVWLKIKSELPGDWKRQSEMCRPIGRSVQYSFTDADRLKGQISRYGPKT